MNNLSLRTKLVGIIVTVSLITILIGYTFVIISNAFKAATLRAYSGDPLKKSPNEDRVSGSINPYFPPEEMLDEIVSNFISLFKSCSSTNCYIPSLLSEDLNIDPSNIVVGTGASELISAMSHRFIRNLTIPSQSLMNARTD